MEEMKYQCRLKADGLRAFRDGAPIAAYIEGRLSGRARKRRDGACPSKHNIGARRGRALAGSRAGFQRTPMKAHESLTAIAEIERLIGKVYFRFSHLFIQHPTLRDYWWEMAVARERCACNLSVLCAVVENDHSTDNLGLRREKTDQLRERLISYLRMGIPAIVPKEAFRIARKIEACKIDVINGDCLNAGSVPAAFLFSRGDHHPP